MRPQVRERWHDLRASLWFVPALEVAGAIVLSIVTIWLDSSFGDWLRDEIPVVFGGTAEGARTLLSVVAGSVITVVAVLFSVTIIALQQAATQYSPRVLRSFMRDRMNQIVLGTYIGTFTYALLVLRQVREDNGDADSFMPSLSIFLCIVLVLVDLALLVYFIHHTSQSLQVGFVIKAIRAELDEALEEQFAHGYSGQEPASFEDVVEATRGSRRGIEWVVRAERDGYLRSIDHAALSRALGSDVALALVPVRVGEYILRGAVIARAWTKGGGDEEAAARIENTFVIRQTRTTSDDALFGIRQLADVALKALSPGINDPTTAEEAIDALAAVAAFIVERDLPEPLLPLEGGGLLVRRVRSYEEYVDECFGQIRRAARGQPHVVSHLIEMLAQVGARADTPSRTEPLQHHVDEMVLAAKAGDTTPGDLRDLARHGESALEVLALAGGGRGG